MRKVHSKFNLSEKLDSEFGQHPESPEAHQGKILESASIVANSVSLFGQALGTHLLVLSIEGSIYTLTSTNGATANTLLTFNGGSAGSSFSLLSQINGRDIIVERAGSAYSFVGTDGTTADTKTLLTLVEGSSDLQISVVGFSPSGDEILQLHLESHDIYLTTDGTLAGTSISSHSPLVDAHASDQHFDVSTVGTAYDPFLFDALG